MKRNLGRKVVSSIGIDWQCFECNPIQLRQQRLLCYSILNLWKKQDEKLAKNEKVKSQKENNIHVVRRKRQCESFGINTDGEGSSSKRREVTGPSTVQSFSP